MRYTITFHVLNRYAEALKLCEEALAMLRIALGPDNPNVATALAVTVHPPSYSNLHWPFREL